MDSSTPHPQSGRLFVWALLICASALSCDSTRPTVDQISRDKDLAIFNVGVVTITPIEFNIDTNRLEYDYETTQTNAGAFFALLDAEASRARWKIEERAETERTYSTVTHFNEHYDLERVVSVAFAPAQRRVKVIATVRQWLPAKSPTSGGTGT